MPPPETLIDSPATAPLRRLPLATALGLVLAVAVAGCGGGRRPISGSALFTAHCQTCHSISGTSTPTQQGGDLRNLHLPRVELLQLTAEMPPIRGRMSARETSAVVSYLQEMERR